MNWWMSMSTTAASRNRVRGSSASALEWVSSASPNAQ
uniref:Aic1 n=1 Tax=Arundo donax TaxID=35708 RepID=A0A0A9PF15_ARUDO